MTARGTSSRFLRSVLQNGVGRYVCQLKRVSLIFSKNGQGSLGAREFIEDGVVDFARKNPGVVVYVSPQPVQVAKIVAEYLNGSVREETVNKKTTQEIGEILGQLANQSGLDIIRIRKPFHTDSPSIQGQWHPFVNRPSTLGMIRPQDRQPE
ncbi:39S ribosomal protein L43, mitochondrial [Brienomyrus brachyistius]|uniref:Large ribosomal subunit protein mL43 n=1 Tax=Paramormyrops kingsleyae TaxID=1676925 RepID=A0A3B3SPP2_9TELE|nr:39S ribosomal protein L43, mitochondrial [Paramormyrops kingsleyae]XP_048843299.1 39S ribosomal protein L43, mitochondrial [Brienomyrus brachyistius]